MGVDGLDDWLVDTIDVKELLQSVAEASRPGAAGMHPLPPFLPHPGPKQTKLMRCGLRHTLLGCAGNRLSLVQLSKRTASPKGKANGLAPATPQQRAEAGELAPDQEDPGLDLPVPQTGDSCLCAPAVAVAFKHWFLEDQSCPCQNCAALCFASRIPDADATGSSAAHSICMAPWTLQSLSLCCQRGLHSFDIAYLLM